MNKYICLFGGRGASSGSSSISTGGMGGSHRFFDRTNKYGGMTMHEFENAIRDRHTEFIGVFDKDGKLLIAGTSYNNNSVAVPTYDPRFKDAYTITHNHPHSPGNEPNRTLGGSFSGADVKNHASLGLRGETRAVSNGPNENTYIIRSKAGAKQNSNALYSYASRADSAWSNTFPKAVDEVTKRLAKKGKTLTASQKKQITYGVAKRIWKGDDVTAAGYEYVEVKKSRW